MSRILRLLLAILIIIILLGIVMMATLPLLVSTDKIRIRIAQDISAWTGYSAQLRQAPKIELFPSLKATLDDVTLSSMSENDARPVMQAERIEVQLSPLDALFGNLSFSETRIVKPKIILSEPIIDLPAFLDSLAMLDGRLGTAIRAARQITPNKTELAQDNQRLAQPFGKIIVEDGSLSYRHQNSKTEEEISGIYATLNWPQTLSPLNLQGNAQWRGEKTSFSLNANQALKLLSGSESAVSASIESTPLTLSFNGRANISKNLDITGSLTAKTKNFSTMLDWIGSSYGRLLPQIGQQTLQTNLTITPENMQFNELVLDSGDNPARGVINIGLERKIPTISGTLAFQSLDLGALFSVFIPLPDEALQSANKNRIQSLHDEWNDEDDNIDTGFIEQVEVDLRLSAQNANAGSIKTSALASTIQIRNGRANFDIGDAKAFGGSVSTNIQILQEEDHKIAELRFNGTDVDGASLLAASGFSSAFFSGKGNVSLFLKAPLKTWSGLTDHISGNASLTFNDGQIQGLNLQDFITKAQSDHFFALERQDNTSLIFKNLIVKANISNAVATLDTARITMDKASLTLAGIVPLPDRSLALSGTLDLPQQTQNTSNNDANTETSTKDAENQQESASAAQSQLHFFVGGSWERPFVSPSRNNP